jgi:hypothetical protein
MAKPLMDKKISNSTPSVKKRSIYYVGKFQHQVGRVFTTPEAHALADDLIKWMEEDESRIFVREFFSIRHIDRETVTRLNDRNEYFAYCHEICLDMQEIRLAKHGLTGKGTAGAIWALKNLHGWTDKPLENEEDHELIVDWKGFEELSKSEETENDQDEDSESTINHMEEF